MTIIMLLLAAIPYAAAAACEAQLYRSHSHCAERGDHVLCKMCLHADSDQLMGTGCRDHDFSEFCETGLIRLRTRQRFSGLLAGGTIRAEEQAADSNGAEAMTTSWRLVSTTLISIAIGLPALVVIIKQHQVLAGCCRQWWPPRHGGTSATRGQAPGAAAAPTSSRAPAPVQPDCFAYNAANYKLQTERPECIMSYASDTDGGNGTNHMWAVGNVLEAHGISTYCGPMARTDDWQFRWFGKLSTANFAIVMLSKAYWKSRPCCAEVTQICREVIQRGIKVFILRFDDSCATCMKGNFLGNSQDLIDTSGFIRGILNMNCLPPPHEPLFQNDFAKNAAELIEHIEAWHAQQIVEARTEEVQAEEPEAEEPEAELNEQTACLGHVDALRARHSVHR